MPRFYIVKGKPGKAVPSGQRNTARRFIGMKLKAERPPADEWDCITEHYEPRPELVRESDTVREALRCGELELVCGPKVAHTPAKARVIFDKILKPAKAKTKPSRIGGGES